MKKTNNLFFLIILISFVLPSIALASWWNPFSWFSFFRNETVSIRSERVLENKEDCSKISTVLDTEKGEGKDSCYFRQARDKNDLSICNKVETTDGKLSMKTRDDCYSLVIPTISTIQGVSVCDNIIGESRKTEILGQCYARFPDYKPYELISNGAPVIKDTSDLERGDYRRQFSFSVKLKNIQVLPFITGVKVGACRGPNATSGIREYYSWGGKISKTYNKALLPGEGDTIDFTYSLETSGSVCSYNSGGTRICEDPYKDVVKVISCDFTVAVDTESGGIEKFKQTLVF